MYCIYMLFSHTLHSPVYFDHLQKDVQGIDELSFFMESHKPFHILIVTVKCLHHWKLFSNPLSPRHVLEHHKAEQSTHIAEIARLLLYVVQCIMAPHLIWLLGEPAEETVGVIHGQSAQPSEPFPVTFINVMYPQAAFDIDVILLPQLACE